MRVVVDTNVLVAGLLSPFGPPAEIVRLVGDGRLELCLDARVLSEYGEVLAREKFGFDQAEVRAFLASVERRGLMVAATPLPGPLPDSDDEPFVELALGGGARCVITGNSIHYPDNTCLGVPILSPAAFTSLWRAGGLV